MFLPELPALQLEVDEHHRHKDVYEHSLTVLEQAIGLEGPRTVPGVRRGDGRGPDLVLRLAALLHDIGKPATRRFEPGGGVSFHHHEVVGAKLVAKRLRALRYDKETIAAVSRGWSSCTCASTATARASGPTRRYAGTSPTRGRCLPRLHLLTRSDSTTRNARKAQRLARTYDDLEARIEVLKAAEELAAVRPELDGNEIGEILGVPPGRVIGDAYKYLLGVRLDEGMIGKEAARERLLAWWSSRNA